jgi:transcriptional regulator with XRE-family HTH domain
MKKSATESVEIIKAKQQLGKKIKNLRESQKETLSLRKLAGLVNLPPSNMKYIEDGVNAPTAEVYDAIIRNLKPKDKLHAEMDSLYTIIRGTPPPDVCDIVRKNTGMNDALRIVKDQELSAQQLASLKALLTSFKTETVRGEN